MTDPLHRPGESATTAWTQVNIAEAFPGVLTPLNWTFIHDASTLGARETFYRIGAYPKGVVATSERADDDMWTIVYGRCAINLDVLRDLGDRMPATSGDDIEAQIFGDVRPGVAGKQVPSRYPVVIVKLLKQFRTLPGEVARCRADTGTWWERTVSGPPADPDTARETMREARDRFRDALRINSMCAFLSSMMFEQIGNLQPGEAEPLMTGYGDFEEVRIMSDLWAVSRDRLPLDEFLRRHGYHGPGEGEMSSRSWREEPAPVQALARTYAGMAEDRSPSATEARRKLDREAAERRLLARTPVLKRPSVRLLLRSGRRFIPLREITKGCFVRALDAARWAARGYGDHLQQQGLLDHAEDVFHLTFDEFVGGRTAELKPRVAERKKIREHYLTMTVPDKWIGTPEPIMLADRTSTIEKSDGEITGLGVSPGRTLGRACVITDPAEPDELQDGDVLVCALTDPSWTSMFLIASAVVIDTGSMMSHGALVARELGIPAVVNTGDGSRRIRTGDEVEVDGGVGTVRIVGAG